MNPQDQDQANSPTPTFPEQSTPEADAAALQAIDALESEALGDTQAPVTPVMPVEPTPVVNVNDAPIEAITSFEPVAAPVTQNTVPPVPGQTTSVPDTSPVEASVAGVAAATGAQLGQSLGTPQTPVSEPVQPFAEKKKSSKLLIVVLVVVIVIAAAVAGYFVWSALNAS